MHILSINTFQDFSEGVGCMKQLKKVDGKVQGNLNVRRAPLTNFKAVNLTEQSSGYILHHWGHPEG